MAKKIKYDEPRDKVLMNLCKKAARKRGLDPEEPSFKAYCTRLYNQTMQGKGLSDFASDRDAADGAERLNKVFKNVGFYYEARADGNFIDFVTPQNAYADYDAVAREFRKRFGTEINFDKLVSQFWASDPATKAFVEKHSTASTEPTPPPNEPSKSVPQKRTKSADEGTGVIGGLKFKVLNEEEYEKFSENGFEGYRVSGIDGLTGSYLSSIFGFPTFTEWGADEKTYGSWFLKIEDLGYFEISDYKSFSPSKTGSTTQDAQADFANFGANEQWSIGFRYTGKRNWQLTKKECDHASHFFGDTVFKGKVKFPFEGCDEVPNAEPSKRVPQSLHDYLNEVLEEEKLYRKSYQLQTPMWQVSLKAITGAGIFETYKFANDNSKERYDYVRIPISLSGSNLKPLRVALDQVLGYSTVESNIGFTYMIEATIRNSRYGEFVHHYHYMINYDKDDDTADIFAYVPKDYSDELYCVFLDQVLTALYEEKPYLLHIPNCLPGQSKPKDATPDEPATDKKRGRGRPPGSKNKSKEEREDKPKRGRGRPPGSKNKSKEEKPEYPIPSTPEPEREREESQPSPQPQPERSTPSSGSDFMRTVGSDVFEKLAQNDDETIQKVYDWFANVPDETAGLITDDEMQQVLDLLMKD